MLRFFLCTCFDNIYKGSEADWPLDWLKNGVIPDTMASMATITGGIKSEINRFDGKISFGLWQRIMINILIQQGIKVALLGKEKKPAMMDGDDWADLDERAVSSILQYISDKGMLNVVIALPNST